MKNYNLYTTSYPTTDILGSTATEVGIWGIIAAILAIVGGILVYYLFVKSDKEPKNKFLAWLKDFLAFRKMWIEALLKILYYMGTIFIMLMSFSIISTSFIAFLLTFIGGPIIMRLVYEGLMIIIMIWRNTADIAKNTKE